MKFPWEFAMQVQICRYFVPNSFDNFALSNEERMRKLVFANEAVPYANNYYVD